MKKSLLLTISTLLFLGCSSKQYYTPQEFKSASALKSSDNIRFFSRDGAVLESGTTLTPKSKLNLHLKEGEFFINKTPYGILIATKTKKSYILRGRVKQEILLPKPLLAGYILRDKLIYLLKDNSFGVYNLNSKEIEFNDKSQVTYSIDTRVANPILVNELVVIPLLNGKLIVFNLKQNRVIKEILISTNRDLNNVIFLKKMKEDTLVSATPHKIVTISNRGKKELEEEISEVAIGGKDIFIFLKDGRILRADELLRVQDEKKFKFAHFVVGTVYNGKVFALERQGFLIVTNNHFTKIDIYKFPEVEGHSFISNGKIYYDDNIIDLSRF